MVYVNVDQWEKLSLLVIWTEHPRCFKNIKSLSIPHPFNKKAWISEDWLCKLDRRLKAQRCNVLVDTCPGHPKVINHESVTLAFLPPIATSCVQPEHHQEPEGQALPSSDKVINQQHWVKHWLWHQMLSSSSPRRDVTASTVAKCFHKAGLWCISRVYSSGERRQRRWQQHCTICPVFTWHHIWWLCKHRRWRQSLLCANRLWRCWWRHHSSHRGHNTAANR